MVVSSLAQPVVSTAEQSCGDNDNHAACKTSKAAKRRMRHRHRAIMEAQCASLRISEFLHEGKRSNVTHRILDEPHGGLQMSLQR